jgi:hypothetical protein
MQTKTNIRFNDRILNNEQMDRWIDWANHVEGGVMPPSIDVVLYLDEHYPDWKYYKCCMCGSQTHHILEKPIHMCLLCQKQELRDNIQLKIWKDGINGVPHGVVPTPEVVELLDSKIPNWRNI